MAAPGVASALLDYGCDSGSLYLVLKAYRCSLREWRSRHAPEPRQTARLYLNVYSQLLDACCAMAAAGVVHFDLKCDNVLLDPHPSAPVAAFWAPPSEAPPFRVVLADFGESKLWRGGAGAEGPAAGRFTTRNRGTEFIKAPEMLMVSNAAKKSRDDYDRRRRQGADAACDVWAVGCLLFELLFNEMLFQARAPFSHRFCPRPSRHMSLKFVPQLYWRCHWP